MAHVLIVDDSPTERHVLQGMLDRNGMKVSLATSGEEGVAQAKALIPDLVLMDVVMPGLNGFQATRELTRTPETGWRYYGTEDANILFRPGNRVSPVFHGV